MGAQKGLIEEVDISQRRQQTVEGSQTAIYITDLLGELHAIAKLGGLTELSQDIESVLQRHKPNGKAR